jgi:hypothetical protein
LFELAGWEVNLNGTPQEGHNPTYLGGIGVAGFNEYLVNSVCEALTKAGLTEICPTPKSLKMPKDNPKYQGAKHTIYVTIGYD